ncbi:hypothetical protein PM082_019295 [Marasmius tenuissimus]|nr:hypothetical protein PM082_019295 [Marasmius tenuissimus]
MEKARKRVDKINSTAIILDLGKLEGLSVKELDAQLKWHRAKGVLKLTVGIGKKNKLEKIKELKNTMDLYLETHPGTSESLDDVDMAGGSESEGEQSEVGGSDVEMAVWEADQSSDEE